MSLTNGYSLHPFTEDALLSLKSDCPVLLHKELRKHQEKLEIILLAFYSFISQYTVLYCNSPVIYHNTPTTALDSTEDILLKPNAEIEGHILALSKFIKHHPEHALVDLCNAVLGIGNALLGIHHQALFHFDQIKIVDINTIDKIIGNNSVDQIILVWVYYLMNIVCQRIEREYLIDTFVEHVVNAGLIDKASLFVPIADTLTRSKDIGHHRLALTYHIHKYIPSRSSQLIDRYISELKGTLMCNSRYSQVLGDGHCASIDNVPVSPQVFSPETAEEDILTLSLLKQAIDPGSKINDYHLMFDYVTSLPRTIQMNNTHYGQWMVVLLARNRFEEAYIAGKIYFELGGNNHDFLLLHAKNCMEYPSKRIEAKAVLDKVEFSETSAVLKAKFAILNNEYQFAIDLLREVESTESFFVKAYAYTINNNLEMAKKCVKECLDRNPIHRPAWTLFALLRTCEEDYDAAILICNGELQSMEGMDGFYLPLALVQASVQSHLESISLAIDTLQNCILHLLGSEAEDSFETATHKNYSIAFKHENVVSSATTYTVRLDDEYDNEEIFVLSGENLIKRTDLASNPLTSPSRIIISARGFDIPESIIPAKDIIYRYRYKDKLLLAVNLWLEVSRVYARNGLTDDARSATDQAERLNELDCNVYAEYALQAQEAFHYKLAEKFWQVALSLDEENESVRNGYAKMIVEEIYADEEVKKRGIDKLQRMKRLELVKSLLCNHDDTECIELRLKVDTLTERFRTQDLMINDDKVSEELFNRWTTVLKTLKPVRSIQDTVPLI